MVVLIGAAEADTITVSSNGTAASTPVLEMGVEYTFIVTGFVDISPNGTFQCDAEYRYRDGVLDEPADLDISVGFDGQVLDDDVSPYWGDPSPDHTYIYQYIGGGAPVSFKFYDTIYGDNGGVFTVNIHEGSAYEVVSVESGKAYYQNGAEMVELVVDIMNIFGPEDTNVSVAVQSNYGYLGSAYSTQAVLPLGHTSSVPFSFLMPDPGYNSEYDVLVEVAGVDRVYENVFIGTDIDSLVVADAEKKMDECAPAGVTCAAAWTGGIPLLGTAGHVLNVINSFCEYNVRFEEERYVGAAVTAFSGWLSGIAIALEAVIGPGQVAKLIPTAINVAIECAIDPIIDAGGWKNGGSLADSLAVSTIEYYSGVESELSTIVYISGECDAYAGIDNVYTSHDSVYVRDVYVRRITGDYETAVYSFQEPRPIERTDIHNPGRRTDYRVLFNGQSVVDIAICRRDEGGQWGLYHYDPISTESASTIYFSSADNMNTIGLYVDYEGDGTFDEIHFPGGTITGVIGITPEKHLLNDCVPNPFNPRTTIAFDLPRELAVSLRIYDVSGRLVDVLMDDQIAQQGRNEVVWRGRDMTGRILPSGTYFYHLEAGDHVETKRMTLLK